MAGSVHSARLRNPAGGSKTRSSDSSASIVASTSSGMKEPPRRMGSMTMLFGAPVRRRAEGASGGSGTLTDADSRTIPDPYRGWRGAALSRRPFFSAQTMPFFMRLRLWVDPVTGVVPSSVLKKYCTVDGFGTTDPWMLLGADLIERMYVWPVTAPVTWTFTSPGPIDVTCAFPNFTQLRL